MDAFWFLAGVAVYYKLDEVRLQREAAGRARDDAIENLRLRAQSLNDELDEMQFDLIIDPERYSEREIRAAQRRADRAQEAVLQAQAVSG